MFLFYTPWKHQKTFGVFRKNKIGVLARNKLHPDFLCNFEIIWLLVKVQSSELYKNKYMIATALITNTEIFTFMAVLVLKLMSRTVFIINKKDNRNCEKLGYFLRK